MTIEKRQKTMGESLRLILGYVILILYELNLRRVFDENFDQKPLWPASAD